MKRFRFSLRSLLLLTLTLAGAGVVWVQRAPWTPIYRVTEMTGADLHYADMDENGILFCTGFDGLTLEIHPEEQRLGEVSMRPRRVQTSELQQLVLENDASTVMGKTVKALVVAEGGKYAVLLDGDGKLHTWDGSRARALPFPFDRTQTIYFTPRIHFAIAHIIDQGEMLIDCDTGSVRKIPPVRGYYTQYAVDVAPDASRLTDHDPSSAPLANGNIGACRVVHIASGASYALPISGSRVRVAGPSHLVTGNGGGLTIWKRRRDENLWGFTQRPEALLTAFFAVALLYSLTRDWRDFRREKSPLPANMV